MAYKLFVTVGLSDNSYLVVSGDEAFVVDPQRDAWRFLSAAEAQKVSVRYVLETHVHNDYVSGAREIHTATQAEIAAPAKGNYAFPYRRMAEGDELRVGALRIVALETPGHTPEHTSWAVYEDSVAEPVAVFTGGSLIVGSAGRTDLLGPELAEELTRAQFRTLRRLGGLPAGVQVLPTHGAGSFCTSIVPAMERTTTVGAEARRNLALAAPTEEAFIRQQLSGLLAYPAYYSYMAPMNRRGPQILGSLPHPAALSPDDIVRHMKAGAWVIDGRDRVAFAKAHLPGALNIELDSTFGTYVGWVTPFNCPLVFVLPEPIKESVPEAVSQLIRIGYERIEGYLAGGMESWCTSGRQVRSYLTAGVDDLCQAYVTGQPIQILDVRQQKEWEAGHVPDSLHLFVGDLPQQLDRVPREKEVWTVCASGHRASLAASLLDRAGIPVRVVSQGGIPEWLARCYPQQVAVGAR